VAKKINFRLLTSATLAQLDMRSTFSKEVQGLKELARTLATSLDRDPGESNTTRRRSPWMKS